MAPLGKMAVESIMGFHGGNADIPQTCLMLVRRRKADLAVLLWRAKRLASSGMEKGPDFGDFPWSRSSVLCGPAVSDLSLP